MSAQEATVPVPEVPSSPDAQEHLEPLDTEKKNESKQRMEEMLALYLASNPSYRSDKKTNEVEIRFGTAKPVSRIDYDNVIKQLYASGFVPENEGGYTYLRIQPEYLDKRTGTTKISNIRAEIVGLDMVQEYCKTNSIQRLIDMPSYLTVNYEKIKFTQKSPPRKDDGRGDFLKPVDMRDFNFRLSYQLETDYSVRSNTVKTIMMEWLNSKKLYRYMNRVRFAHPDYPVFVDISIVKSSKKSGKVPIPHYTIQDAGIFTNPETYEIELEINNAAVGVGTPYNTLETLLASLRKVIRVVLSGLQGTYYPIPYSERSDILQSYMRLIHGDNYQSRWVKSADFIGPSSYTLQLKNIAVPDSDSVVPNIRQGYTVTDKADGERRLLYVNDKGKIYMIDTNMNVIYTGMVTKEKTVFETLIDGEHVKYDKRGGYINLYAAFDIYFVNKKSVREWGFIATDADLLQADKPVEKGELPFDPLRFRLPMLNRVITLLKPVFESTAPSGGQGLGCKFDIRCKQFYAEESGHTIFEGCAQILSKVTDGAFVYNTDGLIFTPASMGVAANRVGEAGPLKKITWEHSFKWKPPKYNTIDFLVNIKKDKSGKDEVYHVFEDGLNLQKAVKQISQYKVLELYVGFDKNKHGYLNPMEDVIQGRLPSPDDLDNTDPYQPVLFQPTAPYDPQACYCNRMVSDKGLMLTEEGQSIEEDTIVEFAYMQEKQGGWKWVPLRVRYDKTAELRNGLKNYGNAYHVANDNWKSIHNPVTEEMVSTGENVPSIVVDEDVYYNRGNSDSHTVGLRDFHNKFVKYRLITGVANRGDTLIDFAVGKAGDLYKWIQSHLSFVFGIDISRDNLENHLDGACARYLNNRRQYRDMPYALFAQGNSSLNIRDGDALMGNKDKQIAAAVFGNGAKDRALLGEGVYQQWGKGKEGFTISSCQFAIHYFFENLVTFHNFMRNVAECTRIGGYFIGTGYDGKTVFDRLKGVQEGKGIRIDRNGSKIYELTKMYSHSGFAADDTSLGYSINVYQETINKTAMEYLVNFDFLKTAMENYGFVLVSKAEANSMGLPKATGLFRDLFEEMKRDSQMNPGRASDYGAALNMSEEEKSISFMNRYFVFRKKYSVDAKKKFRMFVSRSEELKEEESNEDEKPKTGRRYKATKLKVPKFKIQHFVPISQGEMEPDASI
jgi:mRNA capping enzyme